MTLGGALAVFVAALFYPKFATKVRIFVEASEAWLSPKRFFIVVLSWSVLVFLCYLALSWNLYAAFYLEWDLAIYVNACASKMHSSLREHRSLLADHFEPLLLLLTPGCEIFRPAEFLLFIQALGVGVGAAGIAVLARSSKFSATYALILAILYPCASHVLAAMRWDFHPYTLSLATIPWIMWSLLQGRYLLLGVLVFMHLTLKEHTSLFIAGFGFLMMIVTPQRRTGLVLFVTGILVFVVVMKFVFPWFRGGEESQYFAGYYGYIGKDFGSFFINALTQPMIILQQLSKTGVLRYTLMFIVMFPLLLLRPIYLIPILPVFMVNALSSSPHLYSGDFHYDSEIYSWLFVASLLLFQDRVARLRLTKVRERLKLSAYQINVLIVLGFVLGGVKKSPVYHAISVGVSSEDRVLMEELYSLVREYRSCHVATTQSLVAMFAEIPQLTLLDDISAADTLILGHPRRPNWHSPEELRLDKAWREYARDVSGPLAERGIRVYSKCRR